MDLRPLLPALRADPALARALAYARAGERGVLEIGAPASVRSVVAALLAAAPPEGTGRPLLAVTATDREAGDLVTALQSLLPKDAVAEYPAWETLPHERLSPRSDTVGRRLAVRRRLRHPEDQPLQVVVAPVRALLQPQVAGLGDLEPVALRPGDEVALDDVVERLVAAGYSRVDLVERRGEIAVRGGILDAFPPTEDHPLRVEFFGDEVDEIRYFKAADQRSLGDDFPAPRGLWAPPCRELLLTPQVLARAARLADEHPQLADILGKVANGVAVEGMESLAPVLVDEMDLLIDELPTASMVLLCDPERVRTRAADVVRTGEEFLRRSVGRRGVRGQGAHRFVGGRAAAAGRRPRPCFRTWTCLVVGLAAVRGRRTRVGRVGARRARRRRLSRRHPGGGRRCEGVCRRRARRVVRHGGHGPAQRIAEVLRGEGVAARLEPDLQSAPEPGAVVVTCGGLDAGFVFSSPKLVVLTESDVFGQRASTKDMAKLPSRRKKSIDPHAVAAG